MFILIACVLLSGLVEGGTHWPWCPSTAPLYFPGPWSNCISAQACQRRSFVVYGSTCVHSCPPSTFYQQETSTCHNTCPVHTIRIGSRCFNGTYCVSNGKVLFNGTCVPSCPSSTPFTKDGVCRKECPVDSVRNKSDCVSTSHCIERGYFIDNKTCVKACPPEKQSILQGVCHSSCPPDTSVTVNGTRCLSKQECTDKLGHFIYNNTCVVECPPTAIFSDNGSCTALCPKDYVVNGETCIGLQQCISTHGLYKVVFNDTCLDSCPQAAPLNHQGMCVQNCPGDNVVIDMQCVNSYVCLGSNRFISNGTCVSECPERSPYIARGKCMLECPHDTSLFPGNKCISPSECTSITEAVMYNGSCLPGCPPFAPYIHSRKCLSKCPTGFFAKGSACLHVANYNCQNVSYNGSCLTSCPKEAPNRKDGKCYASCPMWTYSYQDTCIDGDECREKKFYLFNHSCVQTCPFGFAGFTDYTCRDVMDDYWAIFGLSCILFVVLMGLCCMMYNPEESRLLNAPVKLQEQLIFRECDLVECVPSDHHPGQQQDNAEHLKEGNMECNSDEELLLLEDRRNNSPAVDNFPCNVIVHSQRDDDGDDVPMLQATSDGDPFIKQADDACLFGDGTG